MVHGPRFLYSALAALSPAQLMDMLTAWGCPVMVERGGRVFPKSEKASDVTRAFEREMQRLGVEVRLNTRVKELLVEPGGKEKHAEEDAGGPSGGHPGSPLVRGVVTDKGERLPADAVILCTGGKSYASTGSTGDGYTLLERCAHRILPALPALVPLTSPEPWVHALQGLSLKNVRLTLKRGKKALFSDIGEMLFTHFGFSGPLMLSASSYMAGLSPSEVELTLDLKPGLTGQQLDERLKRDIAGAGKRQLQTLLCGLYPQRLAETMPALCGIDGHRPACELTREERAALVRNTKALALPISGTRPLAEAIITRGGVDVRDIRPATMESKLVCGLYVAGELLDVDALTGGFNLHIAFATGYLAGRSAAGA